MNMVATLFERRFLLFLAAGGTSVVANFLSRMLFSRWVSYPVAIALAYVVGMVVAFVLMRQFVFGAVARSVGPQALKFAVVNAWGFVQTLGVSYALARWILPAAGVTWYVEEISHFFGLCLLAVTSYTLHRTATFR
jgi:putative flippase GtrA